MRRSYKTLRKSINDCQKYTLKLHGLQDLNNLWKGNERLLLEEYQVFKNLVHKVIICGGPLGLWDIRLVIKSIYSPHIEKKKINA